MDEKKVPVVVTLSGAFDVGVDLADQPDMTAAQLMEVAAEKWGIDLEHVAEPFVVISDVSFGGHEQLDAGALIREKLKDNDMLRVVLPLKPQR